MIELLVAGGPLGVLLPAVVGITAATVLITYAALTAIDLDYRKGSGRRRKRKRQNE